MIISKVVIHLTTFYDIINGALYISLITNDYKWVTE